MFVKVINGTGSARTEVTYEEIDHVAKKYKPDPDHDFSKDGQIPKAVGVTVELAPSVSGNPSVYVEMPEDAHTLFQMNNVGATIDTIRWPEDKLTAKSKEK